MHISQQHRILILDFGSQYTQLIARRVREIGVYSEIMPWDIDPAHITEFNPKGIILSGGPETVLGDSSPRAPEIIFNLNIPILGICYGMQTLSQQLGGQVINASHHEYGHAEIKLTQPNLLFEDISNSSVWMSHGDRVEQLPKDFHSIASSNNAPIAAIAHQSKPIYGLQFHPEVTHTIDGKIILENFITKICQCDCLWNTKNIISEHIESIRNTVGTDKVLLGLSGGVDSSVVAALLHEAIGDQLVCVFVDNGLLRLGEAEQVMDMFGKHMGIKVIKSNAEDLFLSALANQADPEIKRKIIGHKFIEVFESESKKLSNIKWLAQGTIYPDVIESAGSKTGKAHVIKSHHNVGGLPDNLNFELIEPLRDLFKDEVRELGLALGLPSELIHRHPFPGPGLGVRILGEVKKEFADILRQADNIFISELRENNLYHKVNQAFAVFLPIKSVGVKGDARKYDYVIALRAVETIDFMTARWAHLPYDFLAHVSNRIMNEVNHVSRVTYDISGKPPSTIEWE